MKRSTDLERLTICDQPTEEEIAFLEKNLHEHDVQETRGTTGRATAGSS